MQTCVYANASLRLRADRPKKFCKLSFTRKKFCKFAFTPKSGRFMRALVVTGRKNTFQYSALTIYYTTIGGHSTPHARHQHPRPQRKGREGNALDRAGITSARRHGGRGRPGRTGISTTAPAPAATEGDALDMSDHPSAHAAVGAQK